MRHARKLLLLGCLAGLPALAAADLFGRMGTDRNGRISAAEHAAGARAMFLAMDADKDGRVTSREMTAAQGKVGNGRRSGMSSAGKIRVIDSNHDGVLSAEEHEAGSEVMFAMMDRNKDGRLTRGEYSAGHAKLLAKK